MPIRLHEGEGVHVEVVAGFLAEGRPGGRELVDEGALDPRGVEGREGLGELAGLHGLVSYAVPIETLANDPADEREQMVEADSHASANFGFLLKHEPLLVLYGAGAEAAIFTDPNVATYKARQFGEVLSADLGLVGGQEGAQQAVVEFGVEDGDLDAVGVRT